jgi:hypothetical protein
LNPLLRNQGLVGGNGKFVAKRIFVGYQNDILGQRVRVGVANCKERTVLVPHKRTPCGPELTRAATNL